MSRGSHYYCLPDRLRPCYGCATDVNHLLKTTPFIMFLNGTIFPIPTAIDHPSRQPFNPSARITMDGAPLNRKTLSPPPPSVRAKNLPPANLYSRLTTDSPFPPLLALLSPVDRVKEIVRVNKRMEKI